MKNKFSTIVITQHYNSFLSYIKIIKKKKTLICSYFKTQNTIGDRFKIYSIFDISICFKSVFTLN